MIVYQMLTVRWRVAWNIRAHWLSMDQFGLAAVFHEFIILVLKN